MIIPVLLDLRGTFSLWVDPAAKVTVLRDFLELGESLQHRTTVDLRIEGYDPKKECPKPENPLL